MRNNAVSTPGYNCLYLVILIALGVFAGRVDVDAQTAGDGIEPVTVTLDTLFSIGDADGPDEEYLARDQRGGTVLMDIGPDGLIWVLNAVDRNLLIFNADGERLAIMGRSGQGPGEFQYVMALTAVEGGAWTWDWRNQQLCRWSIDDYLVDSWRTSLPQPHFNTSIVDEQGTIWYMNEDMEEPEYESIPIDLIRVTLDGTPEVVTTFIVPGAVMPGRGAAMSMVPKMVAAPGGGVIIAPNHTYELQWYTSDDNDPKEVWQFTSFETPYTARQRAPGGRGGFRPAGGDLIEAPLLPHQPDVYRMVGASREEVWVVTPVRLESRVARVDRIDYQGNRIGSIWLLNRFSDIRCTGDRMYTLGYGNDGSMQIFGTRMTMPSGR